MFARLFAVVGLFTGLLKAQSGVAAVDYDRQVQPIFAAKCFSCHSQEKR